MPSPFYGQIHVDRILTNMSVAYIQDQNAFIASKVFPVLPTDAKSGKYFIYNKDDWFRDDAALRGIAQESAGGGYDITTGTYNCSVYAFHRDVDEQETHAADVPLNMERDVTLYVTRKLMLRQELQWMSDYFTTGKWTGGTGGTDVTPSPTWDDPASTPIEDIQAQQLQVLVNTGTEANTLVLGFSVYQKLVRHPDIIDLIKYGAGPGTPAIANEAALAKIFGVDRVLISKGVKNTAAKTPGSNTFTGAMIAGKSALLLNVTGTPGIMQPTAGYTFMWRGISRGIGQSIAAYRIPIPLQGLESVRIEAEIAFTNVLVGADLGAFFNGAVT